MNRLQSELLRLYLISGDGAALGTTPAATAAPALVDAQGRVRALVLELARPASWDLLSTVWRGVQADLELPAPAIAVSGREGLQLWFALAQPVPAAQALAFLQALCTRYLAEVKAVRLRCFPTAGATGQVEHAALVPAEQADGNWSAFVAPDLAPIFAETPWLDIPPGAEGQADLLSRLRLIAPETFEAVAQRLRAEARPASQALAVPGSQALAANAVNEVVWTRPRHAVATRDTAEPGESRRIDPADFLQQVMADDRVPLALRIEAAKALLAYRG